MPAEPTRLVAVYRSRAEADEVVEALQQAGIDEAAVRVGDRADQSSAAVAEQRQEVGDAWSMAPSALVTKEQAEGITVAVPIGVVVGAVLGLLLGLVLPDAMPLWGRLLLGAGIGALFGGVATMVIGAGLGARGPATPGAAQGTTVSVVGDEERVRTLLEAGDPLRVDRVAIAPEGRPEERTTTTVATEADRDDGNRLDRMRERLDQPVHGDWSANAPEQPRPDEEPGGYRGS